TPSPFFSSSSGPSPASPSLVRALWELRRDPEAVALALRWGDECSAASGAEGAGALPAEAGHLAIWSAGRAGRFDLAHAAANEVKKAVKTFDVMERFKVKWTKLYFIPSSWFCRSKNIEDAEEEFGEMSNCCITPDGTSYALMVCCWSPGIDVYNQLIYVLTRENYVKDAKMFSIMEDMKMKGIVPTISTHYLLKKMKEDGCGPNGDTFLMLIDKFIQLNESGNALRVWT
ncbi:hypothetical protein ZWY2020_006812, partial [Hordeum vulgare]